MLGKGGVTYLYAGIENVFRIKRRLDPLEQPVELFPKGAPHELRAHTPVPMLAADRASKP